MNKLMIYFEDTFRISYFPGYHKQCKRKWNILKNLANHMLCRPTAALANKLDRQRSTSAQI